MIPDPELETLLARFRSGQKQALAPLVGLTFRHLAVGIARYAASAAMADEALFKTWSAALPKLTGIAAAGFLEWIEGLAKGVLRQSLQEQLHVAIQAKDALRHTLARSGLESIERIASPDPLADLEAQLARLAPQQRDLLQRRYAQGMNADGIASADGGDQVTVIVALYLARAELAEAAEGAERVRQRDPLFSALIEDFLVGSLIPESRTLLVGSVLKDIEFSSIFELQVRQDLALRALLSPDADSDAQRLAESLVGRSPSASASASSSSTTASSPSASSTASGLQRRGGREAHGVSGRQPAAGRRTVPASPSPGRLAARDDDGGDGGGRGGKVWTMVGVAVIVCAIVIAMVAFRSEPMIIEPGGEGVAVPDAPTGVPAAPAAPAAPALPSSALTVVDLPAGTLARIESVKGAAFLRKASGRVRSEVGAGISPGEGVRTEGLNSALVLALADGTRIQLDGDTVINELGGTARVDVVALGTGRLQCNLPQHARLVVSAGGGRIEASGAAAFSVGTLGQGARLEVEKGSALIGRDADQAGAGLNVIARQFAILDRDGLAVESSHAFFKAIAFSPRSVLVQGRRFQSRRQAIGGGLTIPAEMLEANGASEAADPGLRDLLAGGLAGGKGVRFTQALPNGEYDAFLWLAGDAPALAASAVSLEGRPAAGGSYRQLTGGRRLGPLRVTVADRVLDVALSGADLRLCGLELHGLGVVPGSLPPQVVLLAEDANLAVGAPLVLVADAQDPEGSLAKVEFLVDRVKAFEATAPPYSFTWQAPTSGVRRISARAVDATGASSESATVVVTVGADPGRSPAPAPVTPSAPQPPDQPLAVAPARAPQVSVAVVGSAFTAPATVTIRAELQDFTGPVQKVEFHQGTTRLGEDATAPYELVWNRAPAGSFEITARAMAGGEVVASAPIPVRIEGTVNQPPTIKIDSPADDAELPDGARFTIRAKATDKDGKVAKVEFFDDGLRIGEDSETPYSCVVPKPTRGLHLYTAVATDDAGGATTSELVVVQVGPPEYRTLVKGIDLAGPGVTIDGNRWSSHEEALESGLKVIKGRPFEANLEPKPRTDDGTRRMLETSLNNDKDSVVLSQTLANGSYHVYVWFQEQGDSRSRTFDLELENQVAVAGIGSLEREAWVKYGPYPVTLKDGTLNIAAKAKVGNPHLMGLAIYAPTRIDRALLKAPPTVAAGTILCETWNGILGIDVARLTGHPDFPHRPGRSQQLDAFELGERGNDYGARFRGYVHPPVTGNYVFRISADDRSQLWLGAGDDPSTRTLIAYSTEAAGWRDYKKRPEQQSAPVYLLRGRRYYIEALHKEEGGYDQLSVAWDLPDGTTEAPIPGNRLSPAETLAGDGRSVPVPPALVELLFDGNDGAIGNSGSTSTTHPALTATTPLPARSLLVPCASGGNALDFGAAPGLYQADFAQPFEALKAPQSFTISGWINCRDLAEGARGGNRLVSAGGRLPDALDLALRADGSLQLGIGEAADASAARSPAGLIPVDGNAPNGNWRFFAVTYDAALAGGQVRFHVGGSDGPLHLAAAVDYVPRKPAATAPRLVIGNVVGAGKNDTRMLRGLIDELRIHAAADASAALDRQQLIALQRQVSPQARAMAEALRLGTGSILRETFKANGGEVDRLRTHPSFPGKPVRRNLLDVMYSNEQENEIGTRLHGFIHPPETGDYTFWITSDDSSELWLSTDTLPAGKRLIARLDSHTEHLRWDANPQQQSAPIRLESGQRYYIEALHKQGGGGSHVAVGWRLPSGTMERPIPGNRLSPFAQPDGQAPAAQPGAATPAASPGAAVGAAGSILREMWIGTDGETGPLASANWGAPASAGLLTSFEGPMNSADFYRSRIRGFVLPPLSGKYVFWISADDSAELRLSTDERPEGLRLIALMGGPKGQGWREHPEQQSEPIELVGGRRYYIEALHREGHTDDFLRVGWLMPDSTMERPIPGNRLAPPAP